MIYIVLAIITSVLLLSIFKLFERYNINTFHAIIVNYAVAAITGFLFSEYKINFDLIIRTPWLLICIPLGLLFISIFYLISLTAQKISIAAASVSNKMSVIIPVLIAIIYLGEQLSALKVIGIVLALCAIYLTNKKTVPEHKLKKTLVWLPVLVFIGSGLIDSTINLAKTYLFTLPEHGELFSICTFACAFFIGLIILSVQLFKRSANFEFKSIIGGVILGIPNYFSIFFIIRSLEANVLESSQLFPVLNISNVVLTALVGYIFFKEKLSLPNMIGVGLAIIAIFLIAF